jgi:hypothetical protein
VDPGKRLIPLMPDHAEGECAMGGIVIHDRIKEAVLNLAGFQA